MATTRSSKAITPISGSPRRRRLAAVGLLASAALPITLTGSGHGQSPPAPRSPAPPAEVGGPSFFEPFDRLDTSRWLISDGWVNGDHQGCTWSRDNLSVSKGVLQLRLGRAADKLRPYRCAQIQTIGHLGYGTYEGRMRTAAGSGLNTALFTFRDTNRDEVDFEFLGRDTSTVQLNYYRNGKGGHESLPKLGFDPTASFNDYAFVWAPGSLRWYVNGKLVREASGADVPDTPGSLFLSLWNGTSNIAGWLGPFDATRTPVAAEIDWVAFTRAGERCRFPQSVTCHLP